MLRKFWNSPLPEMAIRFLLVIPLIYLTHAFSWDFLRTWTTTLIVQGDAFLGTHLAVLSPTSFAVGDHYFKVVISCTSIDVLIGSLPLLLDRRKTVFGFIRFFLFYALVAEVLNILRLVLGFFAFYHGLSWRFAHEIPGGVFLFLWFIWLLHYRGWSSPSLLFKDQHKGELKEEKPPV